MRPARGSSSRTMVLESRTRVWSGYLNPGGRAAPAKPAPRRWWAPVWGSPWPSAWPAAPAPTSELRPTTGEPESSSSSRGHAVDHSQWPCQDSNLGATDYESAALPAELQGLPGGDASTRYGAAAPSEQG